MHDYLKIRMYDEIIKDDTIMITGRLKGLVPYVASEETFGYCTIGILCHLAAQDGVVIESDYGFSYDVNCECWENSGAPEVVRDWAALTPYEHEKMVNFNDGSEQIDGWRISDERKFEIAERIKNGWYEPGDDAA